MKKYFLLILLSIIFFASCKKNKFKIDVSKISVEVEINRFDKDFFSINPDSIYIELPRLQKEYGDFFELYNYQIIALGPPEEKGYSESLKKFFLYCDENNLQKKIQKIYTPDKFLTTQLTEAFKHYKYYFPKKEIPKIYTCISGFNQSIFTSDGYIGISLDKYLGRNEKIYKKLGFDNYKRAKMHKDMIAVDCMRAWCMGEFVFNDSVSNLINTMIYEGRVQYFLNSMLPEVSDTLKWGYSFKKFRWVTKYEKKIWDYLVEEKLLFSVVTLDMKTFTGEAAFTTPFHRNSAPRAGTYVGYKIVESYMKNHEDITLAELMKITDYMKIYNESRYRP